MEARPGIGRQREFVQRALDERRQFRVRGRRRRRVVAGQPCLRLEQRPDTPAAFFLDELELDGTTPPLSVVMDPSRFPRSPDMLRLVQDALLNPDSAAAIEKRDQLRLRRGGPEVL